MFGKKLVSDSLMDAVKGVTSAEQTDAKGTKLSEGDPVRVSEGDYAGKTGTVTGFNTTGTAQVQLNRGRNITISNSSVISEAKLDPVGKADGDIDNDGDEDSSDEYLHNRRKKIKKAMKEEDNDCSCADACEECSCGSDCEDCDCGNAK